ncbi:four and a half LIM domains protein limpet isoform 2-T3 [Glossina fuscipes fuscipes]
MGDLFAGIGDLVFTLVIGYIGAIEFLYVVRHLYHWSCNHDDELGINDAEHLDRLQENMRNQLIDASNREANAGTNAMKDGVFYKDGFRIDPGQEDIDRLSDEYRKKGEKDEHRRKLEEELARQQKIKEQTQRELEEAEALLARQQREDAENARKLSEAKKLKEEKQAEQEAIENDRKHKELEKRRQAEQQKKAEEEARKKEELERQKAIELEQQRLRDKLETEENFKRLLAAEKQYEKDQELAEKQLTHVGSDEPKEDEPHLSGALAREHGDEKKEDVLLKQILEAKALLSEESDDNEEAQRLFQIEKDRESRQKLIDHNALLFLEAEKEMAELQKQMLEAVEKREFTQNLESAPQTPVIEEPCVKKIIKPLNTDDPFKPLTQTVKTQLSQTQDTPYSATPKALHFPGIADNASSAEDSISQQLPISAQPSKEITAAGIAEQLPYSDSERERPEGEDNTSQQEYSEEYLRSLDGIKHRPLVREDGSGRRRAFKKRRSSGSSNSSRDSRTSREEELKMFTSLEEEEMKNKDDSDFTPIRYTSEPTLKVKGHHRRHKRSPVKDSKASEESSTGSLERLGEETVDPWGEVMQAPYKETEFWRREKAFSIDEEEIDLERLTSSGEQTFETATNVPSASSFEDATQTQNIEAITNLQKQTGKSTTDDRHIESIQEDATGKGEKANLIFSGEYTKAMDKDWHSGHFCCWQCDESLTGQRYVIRDDHPYCIKCYENVFANTCEECNKIIGIDSKDLSYKDKHWHEACFLCFKCHLSLVDKQFGAKADKIYCGNCYDAQFASRCDGCGEVFRAGTKKMEYKTRQWHENCFCCCVCKIAIGTKSFIPREQEIYCASCYEEKFATRCIKCNKVITSGGVTYKNEPWHRECFTCTHCNIILAGQRFTSRDEKPYCAECFGELFAKRCTSCVKPITGIGGTRFISFEDRHWHHDCFVCASCKTTLVGRGFITDGPDIICPECAKQKLM